MSDLPIVIAHRGASGYLPEHTLVAKALAVGLGADYLEQDVVATRDRKLVVLHDLHLDEVTDVAQRYPGRRRDDGRHYVIDFDLEELKTLTVFERRDPGSSLPKYPARFPPEIGAFRIAALQEELRLVRGLSSSMDRAVGIYPEIKHPRWHAEHGVDLSGLLLDELASFGYVRPEDPVFVQCFDAAELVRLKERLGCKLRLIQLVAAEPAYAELLTSNGLRAVARYAHGLGSHYSQLVEQRHDDLAVLPLAHRARDLGLSLHPYTFRRDDLPPYVRSLDELLEFFFLNVRVGGVFCDHPDVAVRVRSASLKVQ